jgi:hypothetical protein
MGVQDISCELWQCFSQCIFGIFVGFDTRKSTITDKSFGVFGQKQFHRFFYLFKQVAVNIVLKLQIAVGSENPDFDISSGSKFFGIGVKQKQCRPFQISIFEQIKVSEQLFGSVSTTFFIKAVAVDTLFFEELRFIDWKRKGQSGLRIRSIERLITFNFILI